MDINDLRNAMDFPEVSIYDRRTDRQLKVGDLFAPERTRWPEGPVFNYSKTDFNLMLLYKTPDKREIDAVSKCEMEFRLYIEKDIIDLVFRIGDVLPWSDAPYNWYKNSEEDRDTPLELGENEGEFFYIFLIDSSTGILKALRVIQLGHEFITRFHEAIRAQIEMPFIDADYLEHLNTMYRKFTPNNLAFRSKVKQVVQPRG